MDGYVILQSELKESVGNYVEYDCDFSPKSGHALGE